MKNLVLLNLLILTLATGCATVDVETIQRVASQTFQATRPLSEEEEYFVGRAVSARILSEYPLLENRNLTEYVNLVGNTVALHSDMPFTYAGYHFAVLKSNERNAIAAPGGFIFLTKGLIDTLENEDELAAVLAHEVAHINNRDGVSAIQKSRLAGVASLIGKEAAQRYSPAEISQLVNLFEGSVDDVFTKIVVNGYSRSQESNADDAALIYLRRAGYDPSALKSVFKRLSSTSGGIMQTHPATEDRIEKITKNMPDSSVDESLVNIRAERFRKRLEQ